MNKILVLGGNGFLGKNLNKIFTGTSYEIYNESRVTGCDLFDENSIFLTLKKINPDLIIFCSANVGSLSYVSTFSANVISENMTMYLNLYKTVSKFNNKIIIINPISNCSYPGSSEIQIEKTWWDGEIHESVISYGGAKKFSYLLSKCYERQFGIKTINLIIPNAYGRFDYLDPQKTHAIDGLIVRMLESIKSRVTTFEVWGTGTPIREWIFMEDVARIIFEIIENKMFDLPNPLNLSQNYGITIKEVVNLITELIGSDMEVIYDITKQDGAPVKIMDDKLFREYFNDFVFTDLKTGLIETINYYKNELI